MSQRLFFAIPGDLNSRTGGYAYDRRLITELQALGMQVDVLPLAASFPSPARAALIATDTLFAALPAAAVVLVDGLAFGAMEDIALRHGKRLRLIALCHHPLALETGLDEATRQRLLHSEGSALAHARAIVVTSPASKVTVAALFSLPESSITVAVPGTDPAGFATCRGEPPLLLSVATLTQRKGHDLLIAALQQIAELPWRARFVGAEYFDPTWAASLRRQVTQAGLSERIEFVGSSDTLEQEYLGADVFVLPSRYEGYGMVFAEALAHGLPVVATRIAAVEDIVPATAGRLVPPDDSQALANALRQLLTQNEVYKALRQGAQETAATLPRWQESAQRIATLIQSIATEQD